MKAVVLAGGFATRLWPITRHRPKMLLPIGDATVIDRVFAELEADSRIDEVFVSTNAAFADEFETYLADSEFTKPTLSVEETTEEDEKFGVVGALAQLVDREGIDDDLVVVAGDNLIGFDLAEFDRLGRRRVRDYRRRVDVEQRSRCIRRDERNRRRRPRQGVDATESRRDANGRIGGRVVPVGPRRRRRLLWQLREVPLRPDGRRPPAVLRAPQRAHGRHGSLRPVAAEHRLEFGERLFDPLPV